MIPVTKTVSEWLKSKSITPMMLTVNIDSAASVALRHAGYELFRTDPDNEAEYARAADAYCVLCAVYLVGMAVVWLAPETKGRSALS